MSAPHLQRIFKRLTGITPRQYADACRLGRLKARLRKTETVTMALYEVGYGSSRGLYERASAQLGMTPATYRRGGRGMNLRYTVADCPLGRLLLAATERGVSAVYLGDADAVLEQALHEEYPEATVGRDDDTLRAWLHKLLGHLRGQQPHLALPLDVRDGVSVARLAGVAEDPLRQHADVQRGGRGTGAADGGAGGGPGVRHQSGVAGDSLSSGGARGRQPGRLSLGPEAQASPARSGKSGGRRSSQPAAPARVNSEGVKKPHPPAPLPETERGSKLGKPGRSRPLRFGDGAGGVGFLHSLSLLEERHAGGEAVNERLSAEKFPGRLAVPMKPD